MVTGNRERRGLFVDLGRLGTRTIAHTVLIVAGRVERDVEMVASRQDRRGVHVQRRWSRSVAIGRRRGAGLRAERTDSFFNCRRNLKILDKLEDAARVPWL